MTQRDKWAKRPCVMRFWAWADIVRAAQQAAGALPDDPAKVTVQAFLGFPASYSAKKREQLKGQPHRVKPDRDNIDKGICDILFKNDQGIYWGQSVKLWDDGEGPRVVITVRGIDE